MELLALEAEIPVSTSKDGSDARRSDRSHLLTHIEVLKALGQRRNSRMDMQRGGRSLGMRRTSLLSVSRVTRFPVRKDIKFFASLALALPFGRTCHSLQATIATYRRFVRAT